MTKKRKFNPGGFLGVVVGLMFLAGLVIGGLAKPTSDATQNWTMTWVALGLISPVVILLVSFLCLCLFNLVTTVEGDD